MGNCCCPAKDEDQVVTSSSNQRVKTFQGQGHRLGSADETEQNQLTTPLTGKPGNASNDTNEGIPAPAYDPTLTDEERAKIRADRAAAAEARLKKQGGLPKKKKENPNKPLVGPNSKPLMQWNVGSS